MYAYHTFIIHFPVDRCQGWFYFLTMENRGAMDMDEHVSVDWAESVTARSSGLGVEPLSA